MVDIVTYPNEVLREKVPEISVIDKKTKSEIKILRNKLQKSDFAVGLAATQLGIKKRFFGIKFDNKVRIFINPKIVNYFDKMVFPVMVNEGKDSEDFLEGCLSFPNLFGTVKRYLKIEVESNDGKELLEGFEAIVFQHELDHLNGVLFVDHVKNDRGKLYRYLGGKKTEVSLVDFFKK
jgi:peptide deformylase